MTKSTVRSVGVHEAKTHLSELLRLVDAGQEIEIRRGREPVARLVPVAPTTHRQLGFDEGRFVVPDDFDAPLPDRLLAEFEA